MCTRTVLAIAVICIMAINACTDEIEPLGPYIQTFVVKDSVEYAFEVNGNVFKSLDTVWMFFLVTNISSKTVEFGDFPELPTCGFTVRCGHLDIYNSCRMYMHAGDVNVSLKPSEALLFQTWWNTICDNKTFLDQDDDYPVPPGTYTIFASPNIARAKEVELSLKIHIVD